MSATTYGHLARLAAAHPIAVPIAAAALAALTWSLT